MLILHPSPWLVVLHAGCTRGLESWGAAWPGPRSLALWMSQLGPQPTWGTLHQLHKLQHGTLGHCCVPSVTLFEQKTILLALYHPPSPLPLQKGPVRSIELVAMLQMLYTCDVQCRGH